jgi:(E)-4-hydroxy-3-methyl-but-2-enyl pyrophosphate reductase
MKIIIAKNAGFCMGVRRAVEMALDAPNNYEGPIYSLGPLIHNPQVLTVLKEKGISIMEDIPDRGSGTVLIRAHGVPLNVKKNLEKAGFNIVDATCPRVVKVQTIIRQYARKGYTSIIVGDKNHSEVVGLLGYAGETGHIVSSLDELKSLPAFAQAIIVAQTTQNTLFFEQVKIWARTCFPHYEVFNTVCDSTERRQADVKWLANSVDAVIVVGGLDSANTQRLVEVANQCGKPAYHIETESELDAGMLASAKCIGVTAGASTPNWIIKRVYRTLETLLLKKDQRWREILFNIQRAL